MQHSGRYHRRFNLLIFIFFLISPLIAGCHFLQENQVKQVDPTVDSGDHSTQSELWPTFTTTQIPSQVVNLTTDRPLPPLYLTIVIHNEEDMQEGKQPKEHIPDYDGDEMLMLHFTKALRTFAEVAHQQGAKIHFGSDWTFSRGVENFDPTFYVDLEGMGHEIDAHAHESFILYHEV